MDQKFRPDLTTKEVADILKVKAITVQRMLAAGKMKGYQVGERWRVTWDALNEFRAGGPRQAGRPPKPVDPHTPVIPIRGRGRPKKGR